MTGKELYSKRVAETNWPKDSICDPPIDPREAVHILIDHFLGPDWCVVMPESDNQVITAAVCEILDRYPLNESQKNQKSQENQLPVFLSKIMSAFKKQAA